ncbi:MAG: ATP-binding protein, partial [Bacteroidota bacterium]
ITSKICSDTTRLSQILLNLISNAIKFTQHGMVRFATKLVEETDKSYHLKFIVQDTGSGIPKDQLPFIFQKYRQLQEHNHSDKGTGLGLYIVDRLVKLFDSSLVIDTKEGLGSKFSFTIEVDKSLDTSATAIPEVQSSIHGDKILIVEDNELNKAILQKQLHQQGAITVTANNGAETLPTLCVLNNIDLILMDLNMPHLNGVETIKIIRNILKQDIPIIVLSANEEMNDLFQEVKPYVQGSMSKPYKDEDLIKTISSVINEHTSINIPAKLYNTNKLMHVFNSEERVFEMLKLCHKLFLQTSDNLIKGIENDDFTLIEQSVHKAKSSAIHIESDVLFKLCTLTEKTAREKNQILTTSFARCLKLKIDRLLFEIEQQYPKLKN